VLTQRLREGLDDLPDAFCTGPDRFRADARSAHAFRDAVQVRGKFFELVQDLLSGDRVHGGLDRFCRVRKLCRGLPGPLHPRLDELLEEGDGTFEGLSTLPEGLEERLQGPVFRMLLDQLQESFRLLHGLGKHFRQARHVLFRGRGRVAQLRDG